MANYPALSIANEFLRLSPSVAEDQMKLQKLVYIVHGWNMAINHEPLIRDRIEAWDGGPVVRAIWDHVRDFGLGGRDRLLVNPVTDEAYSAELSDDERSVLNHVWNRYGGYSGSELSRMTHRDGTPWYQAYARGRNAAISNEAIERHYTRLAQAGRDPAARA
ncbi:MAG: Panacea domain-containing protein [Asticcacaulis sp.]